MIEPNEKYIDLSIIEPKDLCSLTIPNILKQTWELVDFSGRPTIIVKRSLVEGLIDEEVLNDCEIYKECLPTTSTTLETRQNKFDQTQGFFAVH